MEIPKQCRSCQSKQIKIYDAQGFLQQVNSLSKPFYHNSYFWAGIVGVIFCLIGISYQTTRWRKAKKAGKKYNWWTDKIS